MNVKKLVVVLVMLATAVGAAVWLMRDGRDSSAGKPNQTAHSDHSVAPAPAAVPAHFKEAPSLSSLAPTLPPERFVGPAQQAYAAARAIPQTLAQLPCYCHCDRGMGHKSLHSCFEDDHAAHCAVCVDEALLAYRLQKEENLSAEQVRQKIIEKYGGE
jgi:Protein of unknown function with PCYCGC motif